MTSSQFSIQIVAVVANVSMYGLINLPGLFPYWQRKRSQFLKWGHRWDGPHYLKW